MTILHREPRRNKTQCEVCKIEIPTKNLAQQLCNECKAWVAIGAQIDDLRKALRRVG